MLQIINPRPLQLSHTGGSGEANIGIVVKCWENARPLIKELEQTVNFAERKCGDLMQQLNLCKEYYEKWSTERCSGSTTLHKRKATKKRFSTKVECCRSSSEEESLKISTGEMTNVFTEKLRNKIFEITNEIKEANRKMVSRETSFNNKRKKSLESEPGGKSSDSIKDISQDMANHATKSEPIIDNAMHHEQGQSVVVRRTSSKLICKKKQPISAKRHAMQKYKLRSKSLPQGVRRKFGFGSFVEIVDNQQSELQKVKSRGTVSSGSKSNLRAERGRPKSRSADKCRIRDRNKSSFGRNSDKPEATKGNLETQNNSEWSRVQTSVNPSEDTAKNNHSCSNFSNVFDSGQLKKSSTYLTDVSYDKLTTSDTSLMGKKSLALAPRQPIPFTICRTTKTFNLGLNIQQVLSLIKSKRHSAMLQAIIKDNIRTARSVIHKTEPNINALYIATSSRLARTADSESCPVREDGGGCFSVISSTGESGMKCKMLTCRQSVGEEESLSLCNTPSLPLQVEIQRPEDVWVVEQPDSHQSIQRYRSRCTCFPTRQSVDYQKVLKQYSRMRQCEQKTHFPPGSYCSPDFPSGIVVTELCPMPSRLTYNNNISKIELNRVQEDLDNLIRRYECVQGQVTQHGVNEYEVDAELDALELELCYREEDWKTVVNYYNQLIDLRRKVSELREQMRNSGKVTDLNEKPPRSRKDPFRPTPSMTLTRVLRQIQCLQDKIKLIDSPWIT